jgi:hypothetical protein
LKLLSRQISVKLGIEFVRNQAAGIGLAGSMNDRPELFPAAN